MSVRLKLLKLIEEALVDGLQCGPFPGAYPHFEQRVGVAHRLEGRLDSFIKKRCPRFASFIHCRQELVSEQLIAD